jgi:hypothetical protein
MMKLKYNLLLTALILIFTGCDKYLDEDPIGLLTPDQVDTDPTVTSVKYAVSSSYELLSGTLNILGDWDWTNGLVTRNDFVVQDIASDDMQKKWNPDGDQAWMDKFNNFSFVASNGGVNGVWSYDYEGISRTNTAIDYLTDEDIMAKLGMETSLQNRLLGEACFLRAFYYFDLITLFGDVPLLIKPLESFEEAYKVAVRFQRQMSGLRFLLI